MMCGMKKFIPIFEKHNHATPLLEPEALLAVDAF
jgi:hypothetical protein